MVADDGVLETISLDGEARGPSERQGGRQGASPIVHSGDEDEGNESFADCLSDLLSRQLAEAQGVLARHHHHAVRLSLRSSDAILRMKAEVSALQAQNRSLRERLQDGTFSGCETGGGTGEWLGKRTRPTRGNMEVLQPVRLEAPPRISETKRKSGQGTSTAIVMGASTEVRESLPVAGHRSSASSGNVLRSQELPGSVESIAKTSDAITGMEIEELSEGSAELLDGLRVTRVRKGDQDQNKTLLRHGEHLDMVDNYQQVVPMSQSVLGDDPTASAGLRPRRKSAVAAIFEAANFVNSSPGLEPKAASPPKAVFADAAAMKEKLRLEIARPHYDVANFYRETGCWQAIARSRYFENVTLAVISFNAVWISIDTDYNKADLLIDAHPVFQVAENLFCLYFFLEWLTRFMAFKNKRDGLRDAWFVFDSVLGAIMVLETWVFTLLFLDSGGGSAALGNAGVLKLLRLVRLSRMAKMARAMPELMIMIKGMAVAMRSVFFTLCLLLCIVYVFSIAFVQLMGPRGALLPLSDEWAQCERGLPVGDQACPVFPTVIIAMNSLLVHGVLPDQATLIEGIGDEHPLMKALIMLYILLAGLTVMNMLVGVLCEVVSVVSSVEKETLLVNFVKDQLQSMLQRLGFDENGDNKISKYEFDVLMQKPEAARALQEVGVDAVGLVDFTDFIFQDGRELTFADFMDVVLQLRGTNTATVKDIVDLRKLVVGEINKLADLYSRTPLSSPRPQ